MKKHLPFLSDEWYATIFAVCSAIIFIFLWFYFAHATERPMSIPNQEEPLVMSENFPLPDEPILLVSLGLIYPNDLDQYVPDVEKRNELIKTVNSIALDNNIPVEMLWTVMFIESSYNHCYPSGKIKRGGAGEYGICQILSDGMKLKKGFNLRDEEQNIRCCAGMLNFAYNERKYTLKETFNWYNSGSRHCGYGSKRISRNKKTAVEIYEEMVEDNKIRLALEETENEL